MSFTCQAGLVVKNEAMCEHCGASGRSICGRLPVVMQQQIDDLLAALREVDRWALVIQSAVRNDAPSDHASIVNVMQAVSAAIARRKVCLAALPERSEAVT